MTDASECFIVGDGNVDGKGIGEFAGKRACKLIERRVLTRVKPKICIHGLPVVGEVVDLIRGRRDDAKVETRSSQAPPQIRMAAC